MRALVRRPVSAPGRAALLLLALAAFVMLCGCRKSEPAAQPPEPKPSELAKLCGQTFGEASAKVKVVAILPVSAACQDHVGLYLISLARAHSAQLSVQVLEMQSDEGHAAMEQHQVKCASVVVNGKTRFDLGEDDKVLLEGPPDMNYSLADLRRVLSAEMKAAYGAAAPELAVPPERAEAAKGGAGAGGEAKGPP